MGRIWKVSISVIVLLLIVLAKLGDNVGKSTVKFGDDLITSIKDNPSKLFDYANKSRPLWPLFKGEKANVIVVIELVEDKALEIYARKSGFEFEATEVNSKGYQKSYKNGSFVENKILENEEYGGGNDLSIKRRLVKHNGIIKLKDDIKTKYTKFYSAEVEVDTIKPVSGTDELNIHVLPEKYIQFHKESLILGLESSVMFKHVHVEYKIIQSPEYICNVTTEKMICSYEGLKVIQGIYVWL